MNGEFSCQTKSRRSQEGTKGHYDVVPHIYTSGWEATVSPQRLQYGKRVKGPLLSVMQLEKRLKWNEPTFLATLSTKDLLPEEIPKVIPPRRAVDHEIELVLGAKPPARSPYRMAPPE
uniref:Uncharacterized protein n=1 Tax=Chenopodium quinoa TaxID=63459 RepID=A0A803NA80_CHEQI